MITIGVLLMIVSGYSEAMGHPMSVAGGIGLFTVLCGEIALWTKDS